MITQFMSQGGVRCLDALYHQLIRRNFGKSLNRPKCSSANDQRPSTKKKPPGGGFFIYKRFSFSGLPSFVPFLLVPFPHKAVRG